MKKAFVLLIVLFSSFAFADDCISGYKVGGKSILVFALIGAIGAFCFISFLD